jgi:predicted RNase H-like HicB family nuclease
MKFEVILEENERGEFVASAVEYPGVTVTGRTEKEALALVTRALELHLRPGGKPTSARSTFFRGE